MRGRRRGLRGWSDGGMVGWFRGSCGVIIERCSCCNELCFPFEYGTLVKI
jgi:hypothetical protein